MCLRQPVSQVRGGEAKLLLHPVSIVL